MLKSIESNTTATKLPEEDEVKSMEFGEFKTKVLRQPLLTSRRIAIRKFPNYNDQIVYYMNYYIPSVLFMCAKTPRGYPCH